MDRITTPSRNWRDASGASLRFSFGANWRRFLQGSLTEARIAAAERSLVELLGADALRGKSFLDVGCGSGLFSLAAARLGAARVVSFDVDVESVECALALWRRAGRPGSWSVMQGSALDAAFVEALAPADVVYSWGVLHHTGRVWEAIENVGALVRPGGRIVVGLYNTLEGRRGSAYWRGVKERYNRAGAARRKMMRGLFALRHTILPNVRRGVDPRRIMREYAGRGMSYWTDVADWLGGLPYETCSPGEVLRFCRERFGWTLESLRTTNGWGVNEYVFAAPEREWRDYSVSESAMDAARQEAVLVCGE